MIWFDTLVSTKDRATHYTLTRVKADAAGNVFPEGIYSQLLAIATAKRRAASHHKAE